MDLPVTHPVGSELKTPASDVRHFGHRATGTIAARSQPHKAVTKQQRGRHPRGKDPQV